jgi:cell volume regulation protein A
LSKVTPRLRLAAGLRPILILAAGLFAFALAQAIGASGFLAAYVCGVAHARRDKGVVEAEARALDGFGWLAQLLLFLTLGLLASPSHILVVAGPALAVALALTLIARPIAVLVSLAPFGFGRNERVFASWAGLRGATPIFLGLAPAAMGTPNADLYFSVAFVAVGVSLVAQGWTTGLAAKLLGVDGNDGQPGVRIDLLRGGAIAAAVVVAVASVTVLARVAAPAAAPAPIASPQTVAELETALRRPGGSLIERLPGDWTAADAGRRRDLFAAAVGPLVDEENKRVAAERAEIKKLAKAPPKEHPSMAAQARRDVLARAYGVGYDQIDELMKRTDFVPIRLAIAQAAIVTGWGTSDAARNGNALFGRLPRTGDGEGPGRFDTLGASIADYIHALNTHPAFAPFREARAKARAEGREPTAEELAPLIAPFASDGKGFVDAVTRTLAGLPGAEEGAEVGVPESARPTER